MTPPPTLEQLAFEYVRAWKAYYCAPAPEPLDYSLDANQRIKERSEDMMKRYRAMQAAHKALVEYDFK